MPNYTNVSNEAAFGIEWVEGDTRYQLAAVKNGYNLLFGIKPSSNAEWSHWPVDYPQRFTNGKPVRSWAGMQRVARRWFEYRREFAA